MNVFCPICWHKLRAFSECKICMWIICFFLCWHIWHEAENGSSCLPINAPVVRLAPAIFYISINYTGFGKCSERFSLSWNSFLSLNGATFYFNFSIPNRLTKMRICLLVFLPRITCGSFHKWNHTVVCFKRSWICSLKKTNKRTEINEEHCDCLVYICTLYRYFMQSIFILNKKTMQYLSILFRNIVVPHTQSINKHCSGVIMSACNVVNSKRSLVKCHDRTQLLFVNHFWCTHLWGAKFSNFMWNVLPNVE